jgi:hypothetical protein
MYRPQHALEPITIEPGYFDEPTDPIEERAIS